jgi:hypothetical protein
MLEKAGSCALFLGKYPGQKSNRLSRYAINIFKGLTFSKTSLLNTLGVLSVQLLVVGVCSETANLMS